MELLDKLGIDAKLLAAQMLNFGILLFVLRRFLYKPVLGILEKRRTQLEENDKRARDLQTKLENADKAYRETVSRADAEAIRIAHEAESRAADERQRMIVAARAEAAKVRNDALERHIREREDFIRILTAEGKGIVRASVEKIFSSITDEELTKRMLKKAEGELQRL